MALVAGLITIIWLCVALVMSAIGATSTISTNISKPPNSATANSAVGTPAAAATVAGLFGAATPLGIQQPVPTAATATIETSATTASAALGGIKSKSGRPIPAPKPGVKPIQPKGSMAPAVAAAATGAPPVLPIATSATTRLAFFITVQEPLTSSASSTSAACSDGLLCGCSVHQFARLLRAIYHPNHYYMYHVDARSSDIYASSIDAVVQTVLLERGARQPSLLTSTRTAGTLVTNIWSLPRESLVWGSLAYVRQTLAAMTALREHTRANGNGNGENDWSHFINLSGHDYPIAPISSLSTMLYHNKRQSYINLQAYPVSLAAFRVIRVWAPTSGVMANTGILRVRAPSLSFTPADDLSQSMPPMEIQRAAAEFMESTSSAVREIAAAMSTVSVDHERELLTRVSSLTIDQQHELYGLPATYTRLYRSSSSSMILSRWIIDWVLDHPTSWLSLYEWCSGVLSSHDTFWPTLIAHAPAAYSNSTIMGSLDHNGMATTPCTPYCGTNLYWSRSSSTSSPPSPTSSLPTPTLADLPDIQTASSAAIAASKRIPTPTLAPSLFASVLRSSTPSAAAATASSSSSSADMGAFFVSGIDISNRQSSQLVDQLDQLLLLPA